MIGTMQHILLERGLDPERNQLEQEAFELAAREDSDPYHEDADLWAADRHELMWQAGYR